MTFIPVTAIPCNSQGHSDQRSQRVNLRLHKDLVGAINGNEIYLKGGNILNTGGHYFINITLDQNVNLENV